VKVLNTIESIHGNQIASVHLPARWEEARLSVLESSEDLPLRPETDGESGISIEPSLSLLPSRLLNGCQRDVEDPLLVFTRSWDSRRPETGESTLKGDVIEAYASCPAGSSMVTTLPRRDIQSLEKV